MSKSPTKTQATQATHFFTAVLAYTKLEVLKLKCGLGHFRLRAQLYTVGLKAMYQQLALLVARHQLPFDIARGVAQDAGKRLKLLWNA